MSLHRPSRWRQGRHDHIARDVAALLRTKQVRSIAFMYGRTLVFEQAWLTLADALEGHGHHIHIEVNRRAVRQHHAGAFYDQARDTIVFRNFLPLLTRISRALAVHECVHALQDRHAGPRDFYETEGAAEIARYWYLLNSGIKARSDYARKMLGMVGEIRSKQLERPHQITVIRSDVTDAMKPHVDLLWKQGTKKDYQFDGWED